MKLYNCPNKTWVKVLTDTKGPPLSHNFVIHEEVFFDHLDGMYSFCRDKENNIVHLPAWADVDIADPPIDNY